MGEVRSEGVPWLEGTRRVGDPVTTECDQFLVSAGLRTLLRAVKYLVCKYRIIISSWRAGSSPMTTHRPFYT
jgi:hypothetical protein